LTYDEEGGEREGFVEKNINRITSAESRGKEKGVGN